MCVFAFVSFSCVCACVACALVCPCPACEGNWFISGPSATNPSPVTHCESCGRRGLTKHKKLSWRGIADVRESLCVCMSVRLCTLHRPSSSPCCSFPWEAVWVFMSLPPPSFFFFYVGHCTAACLMFESVGGGVCVWVGGGTKVLVEILFFGGSRDMIQSPDNRMLRQRTTTILGTTACSPNTGCSEWRWRWAPAYCTLEEGMWETRGERGKTWVGGAPKKKVKGREGRTWTGTRVGALSNDWI